MSQENITFDFSKLSVVSIDEVRTNNWNPKEKNSKEYQDVKASIFENGLRGFIVVRENPNDLGRYEVIDGEQRLTACKELGFEKVVIFNEGFISDLRAKELTLWWQVQVPFNENFLSKLIADMIGQYDSIVSPFSQQKIEELIKLAKFELPQGSKLNELPAPPAGELLKNITFQLNDDQYNVIQKALEKVRVSNGQDMLDGEAVNFICAEYIK